MAPTPAYPIQPIAAPLRLLDRGDAVHNLHAVLLFLLDKAGNVFPGPERALLTAGVSAERLLTVYGEFTTKTVHALQEHTELQFHLQVSGEVDAPTADALNQVLQSLGAFTRPHERAHSYAREGKIAILPRTAIDQILRLVLTPSRAPSTWTIY